MPMENYDTLIIGAGPAGLTAGIYAVRAGLTAIVLDGKTAGGLVGESPAIENYPGFISIDGMKLAEKFKNHALQYVKIKEIDPVIDIRKEGELFIVKTQMQKEYSGKTVILATGSEHRHLGVPGEQELYGRGVSYCSTCDGFFFKGKKVLVVGGGNTAVGDAIYLKGIGCDVTLIHRRDKLRAEKALQDKMFSMDIPVIWDSVVTEIVGDGKVTGAKVKNKKTGEEKIVDASAIFISIGEKPNTELAVKLGAKLTDDGYIAVDRWMRTSVRYVYAAGDVIGGVKQIVTAAAEGAIAALSAYEDLTNPYWKNDEKSVEGFEA